MVSRLVLFGLVVVLVAASLETAAAQIPPSSKQQISSVLYEWGRDWKERNPEAIRVLYARDATLFPALGHSVLGPDAIGDYFKQFFEQFAAPNSGEFIGPGTPEDSGELAYANGLIVYFTKGKCRPEDIGDGPCVHKGYCLTVLKQGPDGKWLIERQSFNEIGLGSTIYNPPNPGAVSGGISPGGGPGQPLTLPPPPPRPNGPNRVKVGGNVAHAKNVYRVSPAYPAEARQAGAQGTVVLHAIISKDGIVSQLAVVSGDPLLVQAALDAVKQWRYMPTLLNGDPVEVDTTIAVPFVLNDGASK